MQPALDHLEMTPPAAVWTCRDALRHVMRDALARYPHMLILRVGADDPDDASGSTQGLVEEFGRAHVLDARLGEDAVAGIALGAALGGLHPIQVHVHAAFALRVVHRLLDVAATEPRVGGGGGAVPMLVRVPIGEAAAEPAGRLHGAHPWLAHAPGLAVIMPASAETILTGYPWLLARHPGPVLALEHRALLDVAFRVGDAGAVSAEPQPSPLTARRVRAGRDVTVVATSIMVLETLRAAQHLERTAGIGVEVIDLACVSHPRADLILGSVIKTGRLLVADGVWGDDGVSAAICRLVCERRPSALRAPVVTVDPAGTPRSSAATPRSVPAAPEPPRHARVRRLADELAALVVGRRAHGVPLPDDVTLADALGRVERLM